MADDTKEVFLLEKTLGEGAFGKVYLISTAKDNGDKYAMKVIDLRKSKLEERNLALQEAEVLRKFNHPHVLHYITSFEKDGRLSIVTEYCPNGDLSKYLEALQDRSAKLEEKQILTWFFQTALALEYLHGLNALHRDLKSPNIFFDADYNVRLGDMGLTKVPENPNAKAVTFCGSPYYRSPEIVLFKPYDSKSDIWSLGVIVYEMTTLERRYETMLMHQLVYNIVHGSLPKMPVGYSKGLVGLITAMLSKDPEARPTAAQIVQGVLFNNIELTRPTAPPKPATVGAKGGGRNHSGAIIMGESAEKDLDPDFHIADLLDSLSLKKHQDRFKSKAERKHRISKYEDSDTLANISADKYKAAENDKSKTVKNTNWNKTFTSSQVALEFTEEDTERTLKANQQTEAQAMDDLALVVNTLTGIFPKTPSMSSNKLQERYEACMVLSGVGNALGRKKWEHCKSGRQIHDEVEKLGGLEKLTVKSPDWMVSEHTVVHLATADALMELSVDANETKLCQKFHYNYKECMRNTTGQAHGLAKRKWNANLRHSVCKTAIRTVCIGLKFYRPEDLEILIAVNVNSSRMIHHHTPGCLGCLAAALFTAYAIQDRPVREWGKGLMDTKAKAEEYLKSQHGYGANTKKLWNGFTKKWTTYLEERKIANGMSDPVFPKHYGIDERDKFYKSLDFSGSLGSSGHCRTLMIAYDAILAAGDNWKELCSRAMFHGGDSDSTGILAAAWYGALFGYKGMPKENCQKLMYRDHLQEAGAKLYTLSHPSLNEGIRIDTEKLSQASFNELTERYEASMVLSGAGDALGYKNGEWEFCHSGRVIHDKLEQMGGIENVTVKLPDWMISDDTVMHLATADALMEWGQDTDKENLYHKLADYYKKCMNHMAGRAPGLTCADSCRLLKPYKPQGYCIPFSSRAGGCGAAMRAMCIGLRFPRPSELSDLIAVSVESGRMTHHHPTGYLGSLASALFTAYAIQGLPVQEWGHGLMDALPKALEYVKNQGRYADENQMAWNYFESAWKKYLHDRGIEDGKSEPVFPDKYGIEERDKAYKSWSFSGWGGSSGHDAPMIAYDALLGAGTSWKELCHRAMFHSGDSDSTGVIAAAWFGAMFGYMGVPKINYQELEFGDDLKIAGAALYSLSHPA